MIKLFRVFFVLALFVAAPSARAVKYMELGQAVKTFIPKEAKIIKVTKQLGSDQKRRIHEDYGWEPTEPEYIFYVGKQDEQPVAYVFVVPEIFNTCFHKYAVGMKASGEIIDTVIIELSCPRSFPVNRQSFLGQFKDKKHDHALTLHSDIDAVTGATLSSQATALASRKAVSLHNLFFGGAKGVLVAENVKNARKAGADMIQEAIDTGETMGGAAQLPEETKAPAKAKNEKAKR